MAAGTRPSYSPARSLGGLAPPPPPPPPQRAADVTALAGAPVTPRPWPGAVLGVRAREEPPSAGA